MVLAAPRPRRRLLVGRLLPAALVTTALLHVLPLLGKGVNADVAETPLEKLAGIRQVMEQPRFDGIDDPNDLLPSWYTAWRLVLQNQIDGLFSALEQRAAEQTDSRDGDGHSSPRVEAADGLGFKITMVGDSTIRMQANVLSWILLQRVTSGGEKQCFNVSSRDDINMVDVRCTGADVGVDTEGRPLDGGSFVLSLEYTKAFNRCVADGIDGDFVYFGCGLHFLQLIPERPFKKGPLDVWVHYERLIEEAVLFYRSGGGSTGRVAMGAAFMLTHSFATEKLQDDYAIRVREYAEGDEAVLDTCRKKVGGIPPVHPDWAYEYEPEEICTRGSFDDRGVVDLNRRAEAVLARLDVPAVHAYDMTQRQAWATPPLDGRHYPPMIPQELSSVLSEITMALRRERREGTRAAGVRVGKRSSTRWDKLWLLISLVLSLATVATAAAVVHYSVSFVKKRRAVL